MLGREINRGRIQKKLYLMGVSSKYIHAHPHDKCSGRNSLTEPHRHHSLVWSGDAQFCHLYVELKQLTLAKGFVAKAGTPTGTHPSHPRATEKIKCFCSGGQRHGRHTVTSVSCNSVIPGKSALNGSLLICETVLL